MSLPSFRIDRVPGGVEPDPTGAPVLRNPIARNNTSQRMACDRPGVPTPSLSICVPSGRRAAARRQPIIERPYGMGGAEGPMTDLSSEQMQCLLGGTQDYRVDLPAEQTGLYSTCTSPLRSRMFTQLLQFRSSEGFAVAFPVRALKIDAHSAHVPFHTKTLDLHSIEMIA